MIEETADQADEWKRPSELLLTLPVGTDLVAYLESRGLTDTLLYRRIKARWWG